MNTTPGPDARRVLMRVDDLFFATRITTTARHAGVTVVRDGEPGADAPHLLIVDLHGRRDPVEGIRAFTSNPATRGIPVVAFFSHVDVELRQRALDAGAHRVLPRSAFTAKLPEILSGDMPRAAAPLSIRVSEMFLSLQGEGPSAGTPAHFLRLQGCDVGCAWCDSRYTWDPSRGDALTLDETWRRLQSLGTAPLIVITGGEPLEHSGISDVIEQALSRWSRVEVETSGVLPPPASDARLFWNVSSKLSSATPRWAATWEHTEAWIAEANATFKIVIAGEDDLAEALRLIDERSVPRGRVQLMPEGLTDEALRPRAAWLAEVCKREGLRMSPRLHVWLWGARRGV